MPITFLLVGPPNFFRPSIPDENNVLGQCFSDFRYADPFRRYLLSNSKVVKNLAKFLSGGPFQWLYPCYHACLAARRLVKFREVIPISPKVIGTHTLNFKPNYKRSPYFFFLGGA